MADVYQTRAQLVTDFANNTTGAITAQYLRDFLYSTLIVNTSGAIDANSVSTLKLPGSTTLDLNANNLLNGGTLSFDAGAFTSDGSGNLTAVSFVGSGASLTGLVATSFANENANAVLAGPTSGSATTPTFRTLVAADIAKASGAYSLFSHFADQSNTTTGNTTLYSNALAAGLLATNGNTVQATYGLVYATSANTKQTRLYFGPTGDATDTLVFDSGAVAVTAGGVVELSVTIVRVDATHQRVIVSGSFTGTGVTVTEQTVYTATGLTLSAAQYLTLTGTSSASSTDITAKLAKAIFCP